jgi:hypothetical protein
MSKIVLVEISAGPLIARDTATNTAFGVHGAGETPVTIPNTEVKPSCGDYTAF